MIRDYDSEYKTKSCERCGMRINVETIQKRLKRNNLNPNCQECSYKQTKVIVNKDGSTCRPWQGEIDLDTMQPMENNKPYMIGTRTCGKLDCCNKSHVKPSIASTYGYLKGKQITYEQLITITEGLKK